MENLQNLDLPLHSTALMGFGFLFALVGIILLLVASFRESLLWGFVVLLAPFGHIIYSCVHWAEGKKGFLTWVLGSVMMLGGIFTIPDVLNTITRIRDGKALNAQTAQQAAQDLSTKIAEKRLSLEGLQGSFATYARELPAEFQQLEKRRKALKSGDEAAVAKFNADAAAYQAKNLRHRQLQQEINATQTELDHLIDERSRAQAKGRTAGGGGGKTVVMYTTQSCPACKVAKQYMAQKGIRYQEIDVETSPQGRAEFQRLGGSGVPLIMVGSQRMEGFNSQKLDQMLL